MIDYEKLNKQNYLIVSVVQSCIGAISPNMRMISFSYEDDMLEIYFDLDEDIGEDREEARDAADELSILTERFRVKHHINIVGKEHIPYPSDERFVIYKQREPELND